MFGLSIVVSGNVAIVHSASFIRLKGFARPSCARQGMLSWPTTLMKKAPGIPGAFQFADISAYLVSNGFANLAGVWYNDGNQHDRSPSLWAQGAKSCQVSRATRSGSDFVARDGRLVKGGFLVYGWFCIELAEVAAMGKRKRIPSEIETEVFVRSGRRCCISEKKTTYPPLLLTALAARIQHVLVAPRGTSITAAYTRLP